MLYERKKNDIFQGALKKKKKRVCVYITVFFNGVVASTTLKSPLLQTLSPALKVVL